MAGRVSRDRVMGVLVATLWFNSPKIKSDKSCVKVGCLAGWFLSSKFFFKDLIKYDRP